MDLKFKNLSIIYPEEGARARFENLVAQALSTVYPGTHQIRPTQGDRGIDSFRGTLVFSSDTEADPLIIYQCKYFPDRINASRRSQIKDSFLRVRHSYPHLNTWVLCVPCKLSNDEAEWWQEFQREAGAGLQMELYDENKLLELLRKAGLEKQLAVTPPEETLAPAAGLTRGSTAHFVGRGKELSKIREEFEIGKNVVVLSGIAGIGKSELAKRFFEINGDLFRYAQFVFIDENSSVRQGEPTDLLSTLLQKLKFSLAFEQSCIGQRPEEQMRLRQAALTELPQTSLLIIDNANDLTGRDLHMLTDYSCRFLVTTRRKFSGAASNRIGVVPVGEMDTEELINVFEENYGHVEAAMRPGLEELFEKIVRHTMTVELVATLMRTQSMDLCEVLDTITSLNKSDARVSYLHNDSKRENVTILEHLQALFDLSRATEEEIYVLRNLALISNCGIDSDWLKKWLGLKDNNAFLSLTEKGWLKYSPTEKYVQLHSLVSQLCFLTFPPTLDGCGGLIQGVKTLLKFENYTMISEVRGAMMYGVFLANRLKEAGIQDAELLVCLADGYAILGEVEKSKSLALSLAEQSVAPIPRAQAIILVARLNLIQMNYQEMSDWYERNRALLTPPELWRQKGVLLLQLGECYHTLNNERLTQERLTECFHLYMEHDNVVGAYISLNKLFLFCKCSHISRWALLHRFKRLCYRKTKENPTAFFLYGVCKIWPRILGKDREFSSVHQMADEILTYISKSIPFYQVVYIIRKYIRLLRKSGNIYMADCLKALLDSSKLGSDTQVAAIWEFQEELCRQCREIGITPDIFSAWTLLFEYIPEINPHTVFLLLDKAFAEYEKQMLVSYYNMVPALIGYAKVKSAMIGYREGVAQLQGLIEYQIKVLPAANRYYLVTTYEALGDMYAKADQSYIIAKNCYKQALAILQETDAGPSEIARLCYKLDRNKTAFALLKEHRIYNCTRCRVCQDLANQARCDGDLNQMRYYYSEMCHSARKFKGCFDRCYAETLVKCGNSISRTSHSGLPYYIMAFFVGKPLRRPFLGAADNACYLARSASRRKARNLAKRLVIYGLDCGIKSFDTRICRNLLCFYFVNNWDYLWAEFFRKTAWRLYRDPSKNSDELLLLLLLKYLRKPAPSPFAYAQALKALYTERVQECNMTRYIGAKDLIVSKIIRKPAAQELIKNAHSGKQFLRDMKAFILTTFLCETIPLGPLSVGSSLELFKKFVTSLQTYLDYGEICAAENLLFTCCDEYPFENLDLIAEVFYHYLETMSDGELANAHFPREEIAEGYQDFFRLWNIKHQ